MESPPGPEKGQHKQEAQREKGRFPLNPGGPRHAPRKHLAPLFVGLCRWVRKRATPGRFREAQQTSQAFSLFILQFNLVA